MTSSAAFAESGIHAELVENLEEEQGHAALYEKGLAHIGTDVSTRTPWPASDALFARRWPQRPLMLASRPDLLDEPFVRASALTPDQIAAFHRDGFLGPLPRFASDDRLRHVAELLVDVAQARRTHPIYGRYSPRDWHLIDPALLGLFTHPAVVGPLRQLMGPDLLLWRSKAFVKPPFGGAIGWHQEWGAFNGAELGNDIPALQPDPDADGPWNVTIWFALDDVTEDMGPISFLRGSHARHRPVAQVPFPESAFFEAPFAGITEPMEIVRRARASVLLLDIDTRGWFDGVDVERLTLAEARQVVLDRASLRTGEVTLPFDIEPGEEVVMPMARGEFVIFYERVMHGSGASRSPRTRAAVNCRVTPSSTLVYPQRLEGRFVDGSNVDISQHRCVLLSGRAHHPHNVIAPAAG